MPEVEIKVLDIDPQKVAARLFELGGEEIFFGKVKCVHFDREGEPIREAHSLFRLRRWEGSEGFPSKVELCFKGPKKIVDGCKVREEIETTVASAAVFEKMMAKLGYHITMDNEKWRRSYKVNGVRVDIDEYPQVPAYLEIEGPDHAAIDQAYVDLHLAGNERSTETAEELFARKWPEVDFDRLKFEGAGSEMTRLVD